MFITAEKKKARSGTFVDNLKLPIHRWFRYSAGFSAEWVASVIRENKAKKILDPFAGSGTTLLAADAEGIESVGFESHVFVQRICEAKISWDFDKGLFTDFAKKLFNKAREIEDSDLEDRSTDKLLGKMYSPKTLKSLERLRIAYLELFKENESKEVKLLWLGITSILRPCSHAGTAQWQYVLPNKKKNGAKEPFETLDEFCDKVLEDAFQVSMEGWQKKSSVILHDARNPSFIQRGFDLLVTSPPYANNYDYADATRLEMTFWKEVEGWKDLQSVVRKDLLRSCSQHSAAERLTLDTLLSESELQPIIHKLKKVCDKLAEVRLSKGGKKTYHTMVAAYFLDLAKILINIRPLMTEDCLMCFVIGDSAPYGIHVPAEKWLGKLAIAAGFKEYSFEKLRDRNVKWDNRVHKVPLHEGNLWIKG